MSTLFFDLLVTPRLLKRSPLFALTAIATLSIAIAGVVTIFALVDTVLLRPLPFPEPDRLVIVGQTTDSGTPSNAGYATYLDWREQATSLTDLAIMRSWNPTLMESGNATRLAGVRVTAGALATLGARPQLGRLFDSFEDHPDRRRVIVLSDRLWRDRFSADPDILERTVDLAGTEYRVIGVLSPSFEPRVSGHFYEEAEAWSPLGYSPELSWACRSCRHLKVFGRLAEGVSVEQATAELSRVQTNLFQRFPDDYDEPSVTILPLHDALVRAARPVLAALLAAIGAVLLIACANVASLQLARGDRRRRELSLRAALGADRGRLLQQTLVESLLLWGVGAGLGVLATLALAPLVEALSPLGLLPESGLDYSSTVVSVALFSTLVATLVFGLLPALGSAHQAHSSVRARSWSEGGTLFGKRALGRKTLVVANLALAFALVVAAGLMVESVGNLLSQSPGFERRGVLVANLIFSGDAYESDAVTLAAFDQILERVTARDDIASAAISSQVPMGGNFDGRGVEIEGRATSSAGDRIGLQRYSATDDYLSVLQIPLLRGRRLGPGDIEGAPSVALVSESAARQIDPDGDALGARFRFGGSEEWTTVVGVVGDVRHRGLSAEVLPAMILSQHQWSDRYVTLALRSEGESTLTVTELKRLVNDIAPTVPVFGFESLGTLADQTAEREQFTRTVLVAFSAVALFLAAVGLYGVVAFLVECQRREIGVRVALGADRPRIVRLVLRQGALLLVIGLGAGAALALASNRLLGSLLFDVSNHDVRTYLLALALLVATGILAHSLPLWRALRIDPAAMLRRD